VAILPDVPPLIVCDHLEVDRDRKQLSLIGLFHARSFSAFPTPPQRFTVYAMLYDGEGEGTIELLVTRMETEEDVYRYQRWLGLPGRQMPVHLEMLVKQCVFPAPGRYRLKLFFDATDLDADRFLDIRQLRS